MSDPLGLSIGATNLVAARVGRPPVMRRAVLTLFSDRAPEVGVPAENPALNQPGVVLSGFVERVGDPVPLVAEDGSSHRAERVLVEALDAMANTVGGGQPVAVAVPAHWGPAVIGALRGALRDKPNLSPGGVPAALVPDSVAALTALSAAPGLPAGIIALVDLGGSGTSITLAEASTTLAPIGETIRYADFSGDQIDQAVLNHVIAGVADANNADPAGTAAVGSLARLRDESRLAKERLSAETATAVPVDLPGFASDVRLTRTELDNLIAGPLAGLLAAIGESLQRNNIAPAALAAVATVGGGAAIPLVTQRLSEQFRVPVITTPQSQLNVAAGAALLADQDLAADAPTGLSAAADAATGIAPSAWAAGAAGVAASESAADGAPSATHRALAWSQDDADAPGGEPCPLHRFRLQRRRLLRADRRPAPNRFRAERGTSVRRRTGAAALVQTAADPVRGRGGGGVARDRRVGDHADRQQRCARPGHRDEHDLLHRSVIRAAADIRCADDRHGHRFRRAADDHHRHAATASAVVEHHHDDVSDDDVVHNDHHHNHDDHHNDDHDDDHDADDPTKSPPAPEPQPEPEPEPEQPASPG